MFQFPARIADSINVQPIKLVNQPMEFHSCSDYNTNIRSILEGNKTNRKMNLEIGSDNFGCLVNCAIRYCLGRCSYMPGLICSYVKPLLPQLNDHTIGCMERDIREAPSYGMDIDRETWMEFYGYVQTEMKRRQIPAWP